METEEQRFNKLIETIEKDIKGKSETYKIEKLEPQDLEQELKIHLFNRFDQFDQNKSGFRTWANWEMKSRISNLVKFAKKGQFLNKDELWTNRTINESEFKGKGKNLYDEDFKESETNDYENLGDQGVEIETTIDEIDRELLLKRAKLEDQEKSIFKLFQQGFPLREIGEQQGFNKNKVSQILKTAFGKIKLVKELEE